MNPPLYESFVSVGLRLRTQSQRRGKGWLSYGGQGQGRRGKGKEEKADVLNDLTGATGKFGFSVYNSAPIGEIKIQRL